MADHLAIAVALAAKWGTVPGIRKASHLVPATVTPTPFLVVFPPDGTLTEYMEQDFIDAIFECYLYLAVPGDMGRTIKQVYPFIGAAYTAFHTGRVLGMPGVVQEARLLTHQMEAMTDYPGRYIGIRFRNSIRIRENVSRSST